MMFLILICLLITHCAYSQISVGNLPKCARTCLSDTSTVVDGICSTLDPRCLCNEEDFINAFSCCLAKRCSVADQTVAIQFNQEQCESVNATAPAFVGCSPDLTLSTDFDSSATTVATATHSIPTDGASTITEIATQPSVYSGSTVLSPNFDGRPMLTSTCASPYFAFEAIISAIPTIYPQIGCGLNRQGCCPYDFGTSAVLPRCPQDYFTTDGGCCPFGYIVYDSRLGLETPCYSSLSAPIYPAITATVSGQVVITDRIFTVKYTLSTPGRRNTLSSGVTAGVVVVSIFFVALLIFLTWFIRRTNLRKSDRTEIAKDFLSSKVLSSDKARRVSRVEIASSQRAEMGATGTDQQMFVQKKRKSAALSPYLLQGARETRTEPKKSDTPQELPGSTHMYEHHPAFYRTETSIRRQSRISPSTPTRTMRTNNSPVSPGWSSTTHPDMSPTFRQSQPDDIETSPSISPRSKAV